MHKYNKIIEVDVVDRIRYREEFYFQVKYNEKNYITKCFSWQLDENSAPPKKIKCFLNSYNVEDEILVQVGGNHLIHPYYRLNSTYTFKLLDYKKINHTQNEYKLTIRGKDNYNYTIKCLKTRFDNFEVDKEFEFIFVSISKSGDLKFIPKRTFFTIEDILNNTQQARNTFYCYFNNNSEMAIRLRTEYKNKENIYLLTFCNLLQASIYSFLENFAYNDATKFIDSLIIVENWILTSGFLTTFSEEKRKLAKLKADASIKKASLIKKAISIIESLTSENFVDNLIKNKTILKNEEIELIYYLLKYSPLNEINNLLFIKVVFLLGKQKVFTEHENRRFIVLISRRKKELRKKIYENSELETENNASVLYDKSLLSQLLPLTYCESTIAKDLGLFDDFKLSRASFFKQCAYYAENDKIKREYLKKSIYLSNEGVLEGDELVFNWTNKVFNTKTLEFFNSKYIYPPKLSANDEINNALLKHSPLETKIVGKYETGFQLNYKGIYGIILFKEIKKSFNYKVGDVLETYILKYEPFSNEFLGTTIENVLRYYLTSNNVLIWERYWDSADFIPKLKTEQYSNINVGDIIDGKVKSIKEYGAFIELGFIDALLHRFELKWGFHPSVNQVLNINESIKVKVIKKDDNEEKIYVSLKQLTMNPWLKLDSLEIEKLYKSTIYTETPKGFIIELENGYSAFLNKKFINDNLLKSISTMKLIKNALSVRVIKIDQRQEKIYVDSPELLTIEDTNITNSEIFELPALKFSDSDTTQYLRNISFEKSFIIENYALSTPDIRGKIELLEWGKLYTILYPTRKKFLIELYIFFFKTLNLFYEKKTVIEVQKFLKTVLQKNNFSKTITAFPHAQKLLRIIEILSLFGVTDNNSISTLYEIIIEKHETDILFSKLSKLLLSANLMYSLTQEERYLRLSQTQIYKYLQSGDLEFYYSYEESDKELLEEQEIKAMIRKGETDTMEFKSTLLFDVKTKKKNRLLEKEVLKTIAAFLNTKGGILLIGVEDSGEIYGLDDDFINVPGSAQKPKDRFLLHMDSLINNFLGKEFNAAIEISFRQIHDKEICKIDVSPSKEPVFLSYKKSPDEFYIRNNAQSVKLNMKEVLKYLTEHKN